MQNIVIDKPYQFVPPHHGRFWPALFRRLVPVYLRRSHGITTHEVRGAQGLQEAVQAGESIILVANHCRPSDPMALGLLTGPARTPFFVMASWHLFMQSRFQTWYIRRCGAFSVYREGNDREAIKTAIDLLAAAERPLVLFPEGAISRANDRLQPFMEGMTLIARRAAAQRQKANRSGRVLLFPLAIHYFFEGDIRTALDPVLSDMESRLSWRPQRDRPLLARIERLGTALLSLKEMEYLGQPQPGPLAQRLAGLMEHLLEPIEREWTGGRTEGNGVARVKRLRSAILPDMAAGTIDQAERQRRWRQLADLYLAQQLSLYDPGYIRSRPTPERFLETVERMEEDLTDVARIHSPLRVVLQVGEPLEAGPGRERGGESDSLVQTIEQRLAAMLDQLSLESEPLNLDLTSETQRASA